MQDRELKLDGVHQVLDLLLRVQDLDALRVRVESNAKGSGNGVGVFSANELGINIEIGRLFFDRSTYIIFSLDSSKLSATK